MLGKGNGAQRMPLGVATALLQMAKVLHLASSSRSVKPYLVPTQVAEAVIEWDRVQKLPNSERGAKNETIPVSVFEIAFGWEQTRLLAVKERRKKLLKKIRNGRMCARKASRKQEEAVVRITGEIRPRFSPAAKKAHRLAKEYFEAKGIDYTFRTKKFGPVRVREAVLNHVAA